MNTIHILNTTIMPVDGLYGCATITVEQARALLRDRAIVSHVGHQSTAAICSELLERPVPFDRAPWDGKGVALARKLNGRPPEGVILGRAEIEAIGYEWKLIENLGQWAMKAVLSSGGVNER